MDRVNLKDPKQFKAALSIFGKMTANDDEEAPEEDEVEDEVEAEVPEVTQKSEEIVSKTDTDENDNNSTETTDKSSNETDKSKITTTTKAPTVKTTGQYRFIIRDIIFDRNYGDYPVSIRCYDMERIYVRSFLLFFKQHL